jgi:hypothetical protein
MDDALREVLVARRTVSRSFAKSGWRSSGHGGWIVREAAELVLSADETVCPPTDPGDPNDSLELGVLAVVTDPSDTAGYLELSNGEIWDDYLTHGRTVLGYDVVDAFRYSALLNCRNADLSTEALRVAYGDVLNSYHLFPTAAAAEPLRVWADRAIPEHAPFCVVKLELMST